VQCLGLTSACAVCCNHTARPRHGSCQTLITLTRRPLSVSRALHVLNSCVLTWRRLPLICWNLLISLCVRGGPAASVCVYRTSAASVERLRWGWRAVAFPCWHHYQSGSTWLVVILMVRCVASAACVYETGLLLVCACRTSAASVEPLPQGSSAVAFPRWLHDQSESGSTWLIVILTVRCCFGGLCVRDRLAACLRVSHFCCFR